MVDHSERPPPAAIVEHPASPWLAEEHPSQTPPPPPSQPSPTAQDSSLQLYADAWDLSSHTDSPKSPADDSLSALEYELAAYNVTLFDAAMDYLLNDATNLTALLPEVEQWKGDDVNMTRSIAVMNRLFTALQARLGDQDSILQRYGLPATSGFNARPVRRTWAQGAGQPYRRAKPGETERNNTTPAACKLHIQYFAMIDNSHEMDNIPKQPLRMTRSPQ